MIGKVIGNYQVVTELARGGMGTVYRGHHLNLPREVAIKAITLSAFEPRAQEHLKVRFLREAYIQSQLDHPNIVRVYEFFAADENYYLVMEYIAGMSLHSLLERQGALSAEQTLRLVKQALAAMDYAHNFSYVDETGQRHTGIIHRDIKPANMLLDGLAHLKITDFGIVKVTGESGLTQSGFNPGTVMYMSPEQLRGLNLDARSDIYSFGVMCYQMLTGRLPFPPSDTGSDYDIRKGHVELEPPPLTEVRPGIPAQLADIVMRALRKDPAERFQTAAEFLDAILDYESEVKTTERAASNPMAGLTQSMKAASTNLAQMPHTSETTVVRGASSAAAASSAKPNVSGRASTPQINPAPPRRNRGLLAVGVALGVVALAGGGTFLLMRQSGASSTASNNPTPVIQPATAAASSSPLPKASTASSPLVKTTPTATPEARPSKPPSEAAVENAMLNRAREYEKQEQYLQAIALYDEYLQANPHAANASTVTDHLAQLKELQQHLAGGARAMNNQNYRAAFQRFKMALDLKPESRRAQEGLEQAKSHLPPRFGSDDSPMQRRPMTRPTPKG